MFSLAFEAIPVHESPCTATKHLFRCADTTGRGTARSGPAPQHVVRGQELPELVSPLGMDISNHTLVSTDATFPREVQPRGLPLLVQAKPWSAEGAASLTAERRNRLAKSSCTHKPACFITKLSQKQDTDNKV